MKAARALKSTKSESREQQEPMRDNKRSFDKHKFIEFKSGTNKGIHTLMKEQKLNTATDPFSKCAYEYLQYTFEDPLLFTKE